MKAGYNKKTHVKVRHMLLLKINYFLNGTGPWDKALTREASAGSLGTDAATGAGDAVAGLAAGLGA